MEPSAPATSGSAILIQAAQAATMQNRNSLKVSSSSKQSTRQSFQKTAAAFEDVASYLDEASIHFREGSTCSAATNERAIII
jgi:hypothetical protein